MVSFICDECQATLKKAKVASHSWQCSSHRFSCIDCGDSFDPRTAAAHLSCISEAEKHQGKLYRGPKSAAQQRQPSRSHSATPPHAPSTTVTRSSPTPSHTATATAAATASPTASASAAATKVPSAVNDDGGRSTTAQHRKRSRAEPQRVGEEEGEEEEEARAVHGEEAKEAEQRTETPVTVAAALTAALDEAWPSSLSWKELRREVAGRCQSAVREVEDELWSALTQQRKAMRFARHSKHKRTAEDADA